MLTKKQKNGSKEVDVMQERATGNLKREVEGSGSSMNLTPNEKEERQETTTFTVLQKKNTRSMSSSERFEELLREVHGKTWVIGGHFNAEVGPGDGTELSCIGHYTLNKANCRGEWMTQWLLEQNLVALNTKYKEDTTETSDISYYKRSKETVGLHPD